MGFGIVPGVSGNNSRLPAPLLPSVSLGVVYQCLCHSQLEAFYSTGEVIKIGREEVARCDSMV